MSSDGSLPVIPEEIAQDQPRAQDVESSNVSAAKAWENQQPPSGIYPFPSVHPGAVPASPTPSTITQHPAADASSAGSAATTPAMQPRPVLGREDNTRAVAMLQRGPPERRPNPEDCKKGALVHGSLTLMRLTVAELRNEEEEFRANLLTVFSDVEIRRMRMYLQQGLDANPSDNEVLRYERALRADPPPRQSRDLEGGLVHAGLTYLRLRGAEEDDAARQLRQLSATIWNDAHINNMIDYLQRIGKNEPSAKEERRYESASLEMAPGESEDSDLEPGEELQADDAAKRRELN